MVKKYLNKLIEWIISLSVIILCECKCTLKIMIFVDHPHPRIKKCKIMICLITIIFRNTSSQALAPTSFQTNMTPNSAKSTPIFSAVFFKIWLPVFSQSTLCTQYDTHLKTNIHQQVFIKSPKIYFILELNWDVSKIENTNKTEIFKCTSPRKCRVGTGDPHPIKSPATSVGASNLFDWRIPE